MSSVYSPLKNIDPVSSPDWAIFVFDLSNYPDLTYSCVSASSDYQMFDEWLFCNDIDVNGILFLAKDPR